MCHAMCQTMRDAMCDVRCDVRCAMQCAMCNVQCAMCNVRCHACTHVVCVTSPASLAASGGSSYVTAHRILSDPLQCLAFRVQRSGLHTTWIQHLLQSTDTVH
eukprot:2717777-Rhodomonas_salina.2